MLVGAQAEEAKSCTPGKTQLDSSPIEGSGKAVDAVDDTTVKLRISNPAPYFLAALTSTDADPVPTNMIKARGFVWSQASLCASPGMGSGPFKCVLWDHAGHLKLQRNENYYGAKPKIREIDINLYSDGEAAYNAFKYGTGNLAYPPLDLVQAAKGQTGFHQVPNVAIEYVSPNWHLPPFSNLDARIAFDAAVDRTALVTGALAGSAAPDVNYLIKALPGYNVSLKTSWGASGAAALSGDKAVATQVMHKCVNEACGGDITQCPPIVFAYLSSSSSSQKGALALQQMWTAAFPNYASATGGISLTAATGSQFLAEAPQAQMVSYGWTMDYPADADWFDNLLVANASNNVGGVNVPPANQLVAQADVSTNATQVEALYQQAEQLYVNNIAWIALDQPYDTYVVSGKVVAYSESASGVTPLSVLTSFYIAW